MINFLVTNPPILQKFLNRFNSGFTKPTFVSFSVYVGGLFLQLKRTSIQSITLNSLYANYENIQYFISEARWSEQKLNDIRIQILQNNRTTKSSSKGVLAVDDSGCKKWGIKTEGAQVQHYGTEDIVTNCNIVVVSAYCDTLKRFPINLMPYIPESDPCLKKSFQDFKSKIELAKELVDDAVTKNINFSDVVIDNWYFSNDFVEFIQEKKLTFISEAEVSRLISYRGKWTRAGELVKFIPTDRFKWVTLSTSCSKKLGFYTYSFKSKLKGLKGNFLITLTIGKWDNNDPKDVHVYVTNHLSYSAETVIKKYALRWGIECIFRDLKENVAFDHYQVRSIKSISRHWHLASLAYSFLLISKLNGSFSKIFHHYPQSCGEQLLLFRKINSVSAADWILKNYETYQNYLGLKNPARQAA